MIKKSLVLLGLFFYQLSAFAGTNLRVISYNVWGLPAPFKFNFKKLDLIKSSLPYFKADVVGLQETFTKKARPLAKTEGFPFHAWGNKKKGLKLLNSGLLTLSKHPIIKVERLVYKKCSGMDCFARKGVLLTRILIPGVGEVDFYNTHLNAGKSKKAKWGQIRQIEQFVNYHSSNHPVVFMGDFNTQPTSKYHDYINLDIGLEDTHQTYVDQNPELSEKDRNGYTHERKCFKKVTQKKLDYIWLKDDTGLDFYVKQSKIIYNGSHDENRFSDHFGLMVDFEIN